MRLGHMRGVAQLVQGDDLKVYKLTDQVDTLAESAREPNGRAPSERLDQDFLLAIRLQVLQVLQELRDRRHRQQLASQLSAIGGRMQPIGTASPVDAQLKAAHRHFSHPRCGSWFKSGQKRPNTGSLTSGKVNQCSLIPPSF